MFGDHTQSRVTKASLSNHSVTHQQVSHHNCMRTAHKVLVTSQDLRVNSLFKNEFTQCHLSQNQQCV